MSTTAMAITGPVTLESGKLMMAGQSFPLQIARDLTPNEVSNAGKIADMLGQPQFARLYQTTISKQVKLLQGNKICGEQDARWMLVALSKEAMALAFFSGANQPKLDPAVVANGHELCSTFGYTKGK